LGGWQRYATADEAIIARWWQMWPDANIGIATGAASNLLVIDLDGDRGVEQLLAWEREHGDLRAPRVLTGSKGYHLYFAHAPGLRNAVKVLPGVDVRTDGGYVVGAGSIHQTGNSYELEVDGEPPQPPDWLFAALGASGARALLARHIAAVLDRGEGRNDTGFALARALRDAGISVDAAESVMREYADAVALAGAHPYTEREALASLQSAYSRQTTAVDLSAPEPLVTVCTREYPPLRWVVHELLPEGLAVLSAPPKAGKSLFAHQLCVSVASGRPFLGLPVERCTALYIDAESGPRRIAMRSRKLGWPEGCDGVLVRAVKGDLALDAGKGIEWLDNVADGYPKLGLVVVDTLERLVPPPPAAGSLNSYQTDVARLAHLQAWAERRKVCMLLVHHTRKASEAEEWFDKSSGSRGITATAETLMVLSRKGGLEYRLEVTGREIPERRLLLERRETVWHMLAERADEATSKARVAVVQAMRGGAETVKEIAAAAELDHGTVKKQLARMLKAGTVYRLERGQYFLNED
jgi:DNA-binding MarR family transcriptional regulator